MICWKLEDEKRKRKKEKKKEKKEKKKEESVICWKLEDIGSTWKMETIILPQKRVVSSTSYTITLVSDKVHKSKDAGLAKWMH